MHNFLTKFIYAVAFASLAPGSNCLADINLNIGQSDPNPRTLAPLAKQEIPPKRGGVQPDPEIGTDLFTKPHETSPLTASPIPKLESTFGADGFDTLPDGSQFHENSPDRPLLGRKIPISKAGLEARDPDFRSSRGSRLGVESGSSDSGVDLSQGGESSGWVYKAVPLAFLGLAGLVGIVSWLYQIGGDSRRL